MTTPHCVSGSFTRASIVPQASPTSPMVIARCYLPRSRRHELQQSCFSQVGRCEVFNNRLHWGYLRTFSVTPRCGIDHAAENAQRSLCTLQLLRLPRTGSPGMWIGQRWGRYWLISNNRAVSRHVPHDRSHPAPLERALQPLHRGVTPVFGGEQ
jgi:hypothetical protein